MITGRKYHGLGNDYMVVDPNKNEKVLEKEKISQLCHRHTGMGADGVLYGPVKTEDGFEVKIYNSDGSEAERSGNGIRIFAKYLLDEGYVTGDKCVICMAGNKVEVEFLKENGTCMRVNMGRPNFASSAVPAVGLAPEIVNEPLTFHGNLYNTTCLSVGNPNCVIMMEEVNNQAATELGPYVEQSAYFPNRMNMQICKVMDRENLKIEIYERGSGYTLASGTGACAAVAAAKRMGLVDEKVTVHMPGGDLVIEQGEDEELYMTGEVAFIGSFTMAEDFFA